MKPSMPGVFVKICVERLFTSPRETLPRVFCLRVISGDYFFPPDRLGQCRLVHPGNDRSHRSDPVVVRSQISGIPTCNTGSEHADLTDERLVLTFDYASYGESEGSPRNKGTTGRETEAFHFRSAKEGNTHESEAPPPNRIPATRLPGFYKL